MEKVFNVRRGAPLWSFERSILHPPIQIEGKNATHPQYEFYGNIFMKLLKLNLQCALCNVQYVQMTKEFSENMKLFGAA